MEIKQTAAATDPQPDGFTVEKQYGSRYWKVIDPTGELVCLTVYKKGAMEVVRRLAA